MSEVYVLVKQVPGRPNGEVTLHGATESELVADTWSNAGEDHLAFYVSTSQAPNFEHYQWEEVEDE